MHEQRVSFALAMQEFGECPRNDLLALEDISRWTSSLDRPRRATRAKWLPRRNSVSAADSGWARSTSTSRYVPTTSSRMRSRCRAKYAITSSVPRSASCESSRTSSGG
jgi:hypothetical protein